MMKKCRKCETEKELSDFGNYKSSTDGKDSYCKDCRRKINLEAQKKYRSIDSNRKKMYESQSEYISKNKEKVRETQRNKRKKHGKKYALDERKHIDQISDYYISNLLQISMEELNQLKDRSPELIEAKRAVIKLKRELGVAKGRPKKY